MPRTRVGSVAHAGCAGHPLTPARSRGGAATYIWTQFAAKPSRAVSSITNKKRQYKIGSYLIYRYVMTTYRGHKSTLARGAPAGRCGPLSRSPAPPVCGADLWRGRAGLGW